MSVDSWTFPQLRRILEVAARPYCQGVGGPTAADGKGIGGAWALMAEASLLPGFPWELRQVVSATYPRPPNLRSGLDQVLQRLLVERPHLAAYVVGPVMAALTLKLSLHPREAGSGARRGGAAAAAGATGGSAAPGGRAAGGAADGDEAAEAAEAVTEDMEVERGGAGGAAEVVADDEAAAEDRVSRQATAAAATEELCCGAPGAAAAAGGPEKANGREEEVPEAQGRVRAVGPATGAVPAPTAYDRRLLPVSWLLQCFGEVSEPLRCLWLPERQGALRAHILAAAAGSFAEIHRGSVRGKQLLYIPGSPVVRFVQDCIAATPPHARMQLLEDAMRVTLQPPVPPQMPPPYHLHLEGGTQLQPNTFPYPYAYPYPYPYPGGDALVSDVAAEAAVAVVDGDAGDVGRTSGPSEPSPPAAPLPPPHPPSKRRRLSPGEEQPGLMVPRGTTDPEAAARLYVGVPPSVRPSCSSLVRHQGAVPDPNPNPNPDPFEPGPGPGAGLGPGGCGRGPGSQLQPPLPHWAALLAHICEEEEAQAEAEAARAAKRKPAGQPRVLSAAALCELMLARGDLFGPADVEMASPALLRHLAALQPGQSADLLARVLLCPASAPCDTVTHGSAEPLLTQAVAGPLAGAVVGFGGGLAAALAVLRRPIPSEAALLPVREVAAAATTAQQQRGGTKKRGRQGAKKAAEAAVASATAAPPPRYVAAPPPPPLTALWILSHVLPVLMSPLGRRAREQEGLGDGEARASEAAAAAASAPALTATEPLDAAAEMRGLACLAALLRQPHVLLPELQPDELLVAAQVLALQIRRLDAPVPTPGPGVVPKRGAAAAGGIPRRGGGGGGGGAGGGASGKLAQRRFAALLCCAFGLWHPDQPDADAGSAAAGLEDLRPGELIGELLAEAAGAGSGSGSLVSAPVPGASAQEQDGQATPGDRARVRRTQLRARGSLSHLRAPLWPAMRPLLALLDHLPPPGSPVATAIHALLLAALLQRCPVRGVAEAAAWAPQSTAAGLSVHGRMGTEGAAAQPGSAGNKTGGARSVGTTAAVSPAGRSGLQVGEVEAGAAAAEDLLDLLVVEAVAGGSGERTGTAQASAVRLSTSAKLDALRLVALAAGAQCAGCAADAGSGGCVSAAAAEDEAAVVDLGGSRAAAAAAVAATDVVGDTSAAPRAGPPMSAHTSAATSGLDAATRGVSDPRVDDPHGCGWVGQALYADAREPPLVRVVLERLGCSLVAVVEALGSSVHGGGGGGGGAAAVPAAAAAAAAAAPSLTRLAPQGFLVRLAAGMVAAAAGGVEAAGLKPTAPGADRHGGGLAGVAIPPAGTSTPAAAAWVLSVERSTDDGVGGDLSAGARSLVTLLRRSPKVVAALRVFAGQQAMAGAARAPASVPATGTATGRVTGTGGAGAAVAAAGLSRAAGAGPGSAWLEPRLMGVQLVQCTQRALQVLAAAVCRDEADD